MSPGELQLYLHDHIPLSKAMEVSVVSVADDGVVLQAPLAPNINHHDTVFGGSASTLAILAAWSLLHTRLITEGINAGVVIQRNTMAYDKPLHGEFEARSSLVQAEEWPRFRRTLARRGKARVTVVSVLEHAGHVAGRFSGEFVALSGQTVE